MYVWQLWPATDTTKFHFPEQEEEEWILDITKKFDSLDFDASDWRKVVIRRGEPKVHPGMFEIEGTDVLAISKRTLDLLRENTNIGNLKFFPIDTDACNYYALYIANYTDCLDRDNNLIENKIRPLALGRKNYLFAGSHQAAQRNAMMYSFFASCKANDIDPLRWLSQTLQTIPDTKTSQLHTLLPGFSNT